MLEQSIVDNALSTSAQPVAVATEKPVPAETTPSQTEEPQRGGGAHTSEEQDEDADAASKAAPADSNDAGHHAPLQELPKKDPQDVPNYDVPEDGAERRRWPMDFMKAQREVHPAVLSQSYVASRAVLRGSASNRKPGCVRAEFCADVQVQA